MKNNPFKNNIITDANLFAGTIIGLAVVLAVTSVWSDSVIVDEVPHIGAGYSYLVKHDMRLNPEHPPLAKDLAAFPLLFASLNQDAFRTRFWEKDINGQWEFGRFLMFNSGNDADRIKLLAKLPMLLFFIFAAILVFNWARRLYGNRGGLIALVLFAFSPTVLAHSRFVTTDMPALFGVAFATYFFINYLRKPTSKNFLIAAVIFGIALCTKFSTFLLAPFLGLTALIYAIAKNGIRHRTGIGKIIKQTVLSAGVFIVGLILVVWPVYFLNTYSYPPERQQTDTEFLLGSFGKRYLADPVIWMSDKPVIRSLGQYFLGLLMVVQRSSGGNTTYFLGEVSGTGWHKYFPIVYLIKEPLAWWFLVLAAITAVSVKFGHREPIAKRLGNFIRNNLDEFAMILWLVIYWITSIRSNLNIGVRHLLPTYPFAIILVSGQLAKISRKSKIFASVIFLVLAWYFYENARVYPYYLTYFNQAALLRPSWATEGQAGYIPGGHNYVVDSNVDWGQDLLRLAEWVKENNINKIETDYFGWADPRYYLKDRYIQLSSTKYKDAGDFIQYNHSGGWLAVSATFLQGSEGTPDKPQLINYNNWLKAYRPAAVIGNSIFVYQIK